MQQNSSAIFITLLVITLMPFCYMSLFVADKQFFKDDPAQSLYTSIMYYLSIVSTNAIVSTMNGVIIMLIIYSMLSESSPTCFMASEDCLATCCIPRARERVTCLPARVHARNQAHSWGGGGGGG